MTRLIALTGIAGLLVSQPALPNDAASSSGSDIVVTGARDVSTAMKTDTPVGETPQPVTIVTADQFTSQGAINISDTVKYTAGITAGPYGRDTREDSFVVRGVSALQFRDGMRDVFSYFASIPSDPYNFSRVEILRGPASVLFGQGSIGGLVNLVSKTPSFDTKGEISATYGSYDRKEIMGDVNLALAGNLAVRLVGRARDAETYIANVPDDRVLLAPSIRWQPTPDTDIILLGLYQDDDGGSTAQFLPVVGTMLPNGNQPRLDPFLFAGKPGWDTYSGRLLQGGGSLHHRFSDQVQLSLKARYIDSDLTYLTHYANFYYPVAGYPGPDLANVPDPRQPYLDGVGGRLISWVAEAGEARLNVFTTDANLQLDFNTGGAIEHKLLMGVDYSWNRVGKRAGGGVDIIDIYDIDYAALPAYPVTGAFNYESQKQLGFYVQDQIRFWDRMSVVLGARHDRVTDNSGQKVNATTFRAGIIGEVGAGFSPFFSYTESFEPITGRDHNGDCLKPKTGRQFEAGVKWQPNRNTLVTVTAFHIKETGRAIYGPTTITQAGTLVTKGIEIEASRTLPGNFELLVNYGYNKLTTTDSPYFIFLPSHTASIWGTKTVGVGDQAKLRLGAGVVYTGKRSSLGPLWTVDTPAYAVLDALAEVTWNNWRLTVNATNLLDKQYFASCLDRGDCFMGAPRNVMATVGLRF